MTTLPNDGSVILVDKHTGAWLDAGDTRIIAVPSDEEGYWRVMPDVTEQLRDAERVGVRIEQAEGTAEGYLSLEELGAGDREYLAVDLSSGTSFENPDQLVLVDVGDLEDQLVDYSPEQIRELAAKSGRAAVVPEEVLELPG